jgi:hypothetical protein
MKIKYPRSYVKNFLKTLQNVLNEIKCKVGKSVDFSAIDGKALRSNFVETGQVRRGSQLLTPPPGLNSVLKKLGQISLANRGSYARERLAYHSASP